MIKGIKHLFLIAILSTAFNNIFSGLPAETIVHSFSGEDKKVSQLSKGDSLLIYSVENKRCEKEPGIIEKIEVKNSRDVVIIETVFGKMVFGPKQRLYNRKIYTFIKAKYFEAGDLLFSPELGNIEVNSVSQIRLQEAIKLYAISIHKKNIFLISTPIPEIHILAHNEPVIVLSIAAPLIISGVEAVATTATGVIFGSALYKAAIKIGLIGSGKHRRQEEEKRRQRELEQQAFQNREYSEYPNLEHLFQDNSQDSGNVSRNEEASSEKNKEKEGETSTTWDSTFSDPVDEILKDAKETTKKGRSKKNRSKIFEKPEGNSKKAKEVFEWANPQEVKDIPGGKTGKLPDGRQITLRGSQDGRPTIEIYKEGNPRIKIRYGSKN